MVSIARNLRKVFEWLVCLETGWNLKIDFYNFEKKFGKIRVVVGARVSSLVLGNVLGIYRVQCWSKKKEKRLDIECAINSFQLKSNFGENLIFSSMCKLSRNWQVSWAILDLKFDKNPLLLKIYLIFIFYIISF